MADNDTITKDAPQFAGIEVPPELTKHNVSFLYLNTCLACMFISVLVFLQAALLKELIKINKDFIELINGLVVHLN